MRRCQFMDIMYTDTRRINVSNAHAIPKNTNKILLQPKKLALALDMDECLIRSISKHEYDNRIDLKDIHHIPAIPSKNIADWYIVIRPGVKKMLVKLKDLFKIKICTTNADISAQSVIQILGGETYFSGVKSTRTKKDLRHVFPKTSYRAAIGVDNDINAWENNQHSQILQIRSFLGKMSDVEEEKVIFNLTKRLLEVHAKWYDQFYPLNEYSSTSSSLMCSKFIESAYQFIPISNVIVSPI